MLKPEWVSSEKLGRECRWSGRQRSFIDEISWALIIPGLFGVFCKVKLQAD